MKKLQYVLIALTIIFLGTIFGIMFNFAPEYTYDLSKNSEPEANKILYEYEYQEINSFLDSKELKDEFRQEFTLNSVQAFSYDLNNDGTDEILGYALSRHTIGSKGITGFVILQKNKNGYKDISPILFYPYRGNVVILKSKHKGYNKIFLENRFGIQYNSKTGYYEWAYTLDIIDYIRAHLR